ncbi:hypothetical protein D7V86_01665 [bacterium D16-51]|nr:hypothetical protein D7V96_01095 [bacterium D16-59]RKI62508.1 hypothetical protein D7V86_01665 [bacterium D16-51]
MAENGRLKDSYVSNYSFEVQLGLVIKISFSRISNIASEGEVEVISDGGNTDRMFFFEKPKRRPDTITFSKGLSKGLNAMVMSWLVQGLKVNDIMILVKKGGGIEKIFYIEQGILTKIAYSDLDAMRGEIIIKTMEMQHTGIVEIPL